MRIRLKRIFVIFVLLGCINLPVILAQEEVIPLGGPKNGNVLCFLEHLWGSAWGATMGFSYHLVSGIQPQRVIDYFYDNWWSIWVWTGDIPGFRRLKF